MFCIFLHIQDNFIYAVSEVGHVFETEVYALCGMLWTGNLGQTVEKIYVSQEAEAEGTGYQQLTYCTNETRTRSSCFSDSYGHGSGGSFSRTKRKFSFDFWICFSKEATSIVTGFSAEPNDISFFTYYHQVFIYYHQSSTGNLCEQPKR